MSKNARETFLIGGDDDFNLGIKREDWNGPLLERKCKYSDTDIPPPISAIEGLNEFLKPRRKSDQWVKFGGKCDKDLRVPAVKDEYEWI